MGKITHKKIKYLNVLIGDFMNQIKILDPYELFVFMRLSTHYVEQSGIIKYDEEILKRKCDIHLHPDQAYTKAFESVIKLCFDIDKNKFMIMKTDMFSSFTDAVKNARGRMKASTKELKSPQQRSEINRQNASKRWDKKPQQKSNIKPVTKTAKKALCKNMQTFKDKDKDKYISKDINKKTSKKDFACFDEFTKTTVLQIHGISDTDSSSLSPYKIKKLISEMERFKLIAGEKNLGTEGKMKKVLEFGLKSEFWRVKLKKVDSFVKHFKTMSDQLNKQFANKKRVSVSKVADDFGSSKRFAL